MASPSRARAAPRQRPPPPEHSAIVAERCRRSFRYFLPKAWPHIEPEAFTPGWHIDAIAEHLDALFRGDITRLIVNIPPRHGKSLIASVLWPAWVWLNNPGERFLFVSYSGELAERDASMSRALMRSSWYQSIARRRDGEPIFRLWDPSRPETKKLKDKENWFENDRHGRRISVGLDGKITGEGGSIVAIDDPHNPKTALSDAERAHALLIHDRTLATRGNDPRKVKRLTIMQRLHDDDLTGHLRRKKAGHVHLRLPGRFEANDPCSTSLGSKTWTDPRIEEGELLWPDRFTDEALTAIEKDLGPIGTAGQIQQRPSPEGGAIFKLEWVRTWTALPAEAEVTERLLSWDLAFEGDDTSSFVVGQVWLFAGARAYLLDQFRAQVDYVATELAFEAQVGKWKKHVTKLIEKKANASALRSRVQNKITGITPVKVGRSDKKARARAVTPFWAAGNVFVPDPSTAPWVADFLSELQLFPNARHDDQVDAMSQALSYVWIPADPDDEDNSENLKAWAKATL